MDNKKTEKRQDLQPNEFIQDSETEVIEMVPEEEYKKSLKKKRKKALLLFLFFVVQAIVYLCFFAEIQTSDLSNRVSRQIEHSLTGKNTLSVGTYTGDTDFGYFFGDGVFEYKSGAVYKGEFNNGNFEGTGLLTTPNEGKYSGGFKESQKSGKGIFTWDDGSEYSGEWKEDKMNGQGTYTSFDNVVYTGTFENNKFRDGFCRFENDTGSYSIKYKDAKISKAEITFKDGTTYIGECNKSNITGNGTMKYKNGDEYTGAYSEGLRNGQGVYTWKNGDKYDGSWKSDVMSGTGKYTYSNGSCAQGTFKNNTFVDGSYTVSNSFGKYTFVIKNKKAVSVNMKLKNGTTYDGDMKNDKLTGQAQITYSNGDSYSGHVKHSLQPSDYSAGTIDESMLSPEEKEMVEKIVGEIDISNVQQVVNFGNAAQRNITDFSTTVLKKVKTHDLGDIGTSLKELTTAIDETTEQPKKGIRGLFQKAKRGVDAIKANYAKAESNVDKIEKDLLAHESVLVRDISVYQQMYELNLQYYKELTVYIIAGKKALDIAKNGRLSELKSIADKSDKQEDVQNYRDFEDLCYRFEKKIADLELTRMVSIQSAPQIRMLQNNDREMLDKIQSAIANTIPLWRNQLVISLGIEHTKRALDAQSILTDKTNELLRKNSEMLKIATVGVAEAAERPIVDIETLQQCNKDLIASIKEVIKIHEQGAASREKAQQELLRLEVELKQAMLEVSNQ